MARVSSPAYLRSNQIPEDSRSKLNWQADYPKYSLLQGHGGLRLGGEPCRVALDVCHWWRDRGVFPSVTRLASTEKRKGNKMWVPW